jgi:hypothetical protein
MNLSSVHIFLLCFLFFTSVSTACSAQSMRGTRYADKPDSSLNKMYNERNGTYPYYVWHSGRRHSRRYYRRRYKEDRRYYDYYYDRNSHYQRNYEGDEDEPSYYRGGGY